MICRVRFGIQAFPSGFLYPVIKISLQLLNGFIQVLPERNLITFLKDCLVEPFADAIGLRVFDLGFGGVQLCMSNLATGVDISLL